MMSSFLVIIIAITLNPHSHKYDNESSINLKSLGSHFKIQFFFCDSSKSSSSKWVIAAMLTFEIGFITHAGMFIF